MDAVGARSAEESEAAVYSMSVGKHPLTERVCIQRRSDKIGSEASRWVLGRTAIRARGQ